MYFHFSQLWEGHLHLVARPGKRGAQTKPQLVQFWACLLCSRGFGFSSCTLIQQHFPNFQGVLLCQRKAWRFLAGHSAVSYSPDSTHSAQPEQEGIKLSSQHLVWIQQERCCGVTHMHTHTHTFWGLQVSGCGDIPVVSEGGGVSEEKIWLSINSRLLFTWLSLIVSIESNSKQCLY